ncbi:hypothetical protein RBU61_11575 [Tissierella sp. MB52-C2]|uniref:hypothetical protein n=1 Tax=Tissierella sp. MB52-C2 TaxID=3070999 RepID=UPI00280A6370|nr:hypothetical protein [Tissierella sp. MB52-C2]WMM23591.1 hypothetical protein RBU61_11575 [Tissierella sp. MB52-C2]
MPPKTIVNRDEVLFAALQLIHKDGIESLNARNLAQILGCSTKPLFRIYENMEELKTDTISYINKYCSEYLHKSYDIYPAYLGIAMRYISFAKDESNLFKVLFMSNLITDNTIRDMLSDDDIKKILNEVSKDFQIDSKEAQGVYQKMWLLSHGIASVIATNIDSLKIEEAKHIILDSFKGFILSVKEEG